MTSLEGQGLLRLESIIDLKKDFKIIDYSLSSNCKLFGALTRTKYLVVNFFEWLANPQGLRQTSALQIKTRTV